MYLSSQPKIHSLHVVQVGVFVPNAGKYLHHVSGITFNGVLLDGHDARFQRAHMELVGKYL